MYPTEECELALRTQSYRNRRDDCDVCQIERKNQLEARELTFAGHRRDRCAATARPDRLLFDGEVYGLVGPNGAGKTTTFKVLATLSKPDEGRVLIDGLDATVSIPEVRRNLGFMPDSFGGYDAFKVEEYIDYFGALYGMTRADRRARGAAVLDLTDLAAKKGAPVRALSKGMKQRLCLAKTLLHDPKVLILDEPAAGLDPRARVEIRSLLSELRSMGKTLILSVVPSLDTPVCESQTGTLAAATLPAGVSLLTVSRDLLPAQRRFLEDNGVKTTLSSDFRNGAFGLMPTEPTRAQVQGRRDVQDVWIVGLEQMRQACLRHHECASRVDLVHQIDNRLHFFDVKSIFFRIFSNYISGNKGRYIIPGLTRQSFQFPEVTGIILTHCTFDSSGIAIIPCHRQIPISESFI